MEDFIFIKEGRLYVKLTFGSIVFVKASRNYVRITTQKKTHLVLMTLKEVDEILPSNKFLRIHKSYVVNLDCVLSFDQKTVYLKNILLPLGPLYKHALWKRTVPNEER